MRTTLALFMLLLAAAAAATQTPPRDQIAAARTGSASITGTVAIDDGSGAPLRRATVTLSRAGMKDVRTTLSDDEGRYLFAGLPAGTYTLSVTKGAFLPMNYGAATSAARGRSITLADGQSFMAEPVALHRGAVIAGHVFDRQGGPVERTSVMASQVVVVNGQRRPRRVFPSSTDARGEYRIYGLPPGEYVVYANTPSFGDEAAETTAAELAWARRPVGPAPQPGRRYSYAPALFPGTVSDAAASLIALGRGEERLGVDFSLQYVPVSHVSGVVTGPDGRPAPNAVLWWAPKRGSQFTRTLPLQSRTGSDGAFDINGVTPGDYVLTAKGAPAGARSGGQAPAPSPLWALVELNLAGQDVAGLAVRLQVGASVSGRIVANGAASTLPPDLAGLTGIGLQLRSLEPAIGGNAWWNARVNADGTFRIEGVPPGGFRLVATTPSIGQTSQASSWFVRSAMAGTRDLLDFPLEVPQGGDVSNVLITLSDTQTEVSGKLLDANEQPAPDLHVFLFPTDRAMWTQDSRRIRWTQANEAGAYSITGLPAGTYHVCVLTEVDSALQFEPDYLERLVPQAGTIRLTDGEKHTQDLRIGGAAWVGVFKASR